MPGPGSLDGGGTPRYLCDPAAKSLPVSLRRRMRGASGRCEVVGDPPDAREWYLPRLFEIRGSRRGDVEAVHAWVKEYRRGPLPPRLRLVPTPERVSHPLVASIAVGSDTTHELADPGSTPAGGISGGSWRRLADEQHGCRRTGIAYLDPPGMLPIRHRIPGHDHRRGIGCS
jgi:hypothetical protein